MKKLGLLLMPLMAVSLLASCGGGDKPEPSEYMLSITLDNCKIEEESTTYSKKYAKGATIDAINVTPIGDCLLGNNSVPTEYKDYWKESTTPGTWTFSGLTMNEDHKFTISATGSVALTIELNNCKIGESTTYTKVYAKGATIDPVMVTPNDGLSLTSDSVSKEYQQYWSNNDGWKFHDLVMKQSYAITINAGCPIITNNDDITIYPNLAIPNQKYEGSISISDKAKNSKMLPLNGLDSVLIGNDTPMEDKTLECVYEVGDDNKDSSFKMPFEESIVPGVHIEVSLTTKDIASARWRDYVNWWDYCSNGVEGIQASKGNPNDVGSIVNATINGKVHEIRLIDVDHINAEGEDPEAHCTFEFKDIITGSDGEVIVTPWNDKDDIDSTNYNFPTSTLNDLLNNNKNCIFNQLPSGLQGKIKEVNKMVACGESYVATSYLTKLFPLAHDEILGDIGAGESAAKEGTQYAYYKTIEIYEPEPYPNYWLRSPCTSFEYNCEAWSYVNDEGTRLVGHHPINEEWHFSPIAPAFCI